MENSPTLPCILLEIFRFVFTSIGCCGTIDEFHPNLTSGEGHILPILHFFMENNPTLPCILLEIQSSVNQYWLFGHHWRCWLVSTILVCLWLLLITYAHKTILNTPFQQHSIFSNTETLWGVFFFFCIFFFTIRFFSIEKFVILKNSLFCMLNVLPLITASTEMWYPQIWIRYWDWWLLNGHLAHGSTPN